MNEENLNLEIRKFLKNTSVLFVNKDEAIELVKSDIKYKNKEIVKTYK